MPDDLTAFLAMVSADADQETMTHRPEDCSDWRNSCSAHNTLRLAGMVRAAAGLADGWTEGWYASSSALDEDRAWVRAACGAKVREAITREITGPGTGQQPEESGDG